MPLHLDAAPDGIGFVALDEAAGYIASAEQIDGALTLNVTVGESEMGPPSLSLTVLLPDKGGEPRGHLFVHREDGTGYCVRFAADRLQAGPITPAP
jgi:hypothetical protein